MTMMLALGTSTPTSITVVDDQNGKIARGERRHDAILLLAGESAMHQADLIAEARLELGMALLRRGNVEHLGFGHERAHPIDLRALVDGAGETLYHLFLPLARR